MRLVFFLCFFQLNGVAAGDPSNCFSCHVSTFKCVKDPFGGEFDSLIACEYACRAGPTSITGRRLWPSPRTKGRLRLGPKPEHAGASTSVAERAGFSGGDGDGAAGAGRHARVCSLSAKAARSSPSSGSPSEASSSAAGGTLAMSRPRSAKAGATAGATGRD